MDNSGKSKNERSCQTPKPYDRRKTLLDSVKDVFSPSWLVDLVHSVKKKTPPANEKAGKVSDLNDFNLQRSCKQQQSNAYSTNNGLEQNASNLDLNPNGTPLTRNPPAPSYQNRFTNTGNSIQTDSSQLQNYSTVQKMAQMAANQQSSLPSDNIQYSGQRKFDPSSNFLVNGQEDNTEMRDINASRYVNNKGSSDQFHGRADFNQIHQMRQEYGGSFTPRKEIEERAVSSYKAETPNVSSSKFLWSVDKKHEREEYESPAPPAKRYKPSFNTTLFGSNYDKSTVSSPNFESSFYPGKTVYGGASAHKKEKYTPVSARAMMPNIRQVQAQSVGQSSSVVNSSTAKKILDSLERMSTPLKDAKKIPTFNSQMIDSSLVFSPGIYNRRNFSTSKSIHNQNGPPPPIRGFSTPSSAIVNKNLQHKTLAPSLQNQKDFKQMTNCTQSSQHAWEREDVAADAGNTRTGKMKRERQTFHSSRKDDDGPVLEVPQLSTGFTLPVKNLPKIDFGKNTKTSSSSNNLARPPLRSPVSSSSKVSMTQNTSTSKSIASRNDQMFSFSSPIATNIPQQSLVDNASPKEFIFSSPLNAQDMSTTEQVKKSSPVNIPVMPVMHMPKSENLVLKTKPIVNNNVKKVDSNVGGASSDGINVATAFKSGSVMDILGKGVRSGSAVVSKSSTEDDISIKSQTAVATTNSFDKLMQTQAAMWSCPTCCVSNSQEKTRCPCCETLKPPSPTKSQTVNSSKSNEPTKNLFGNLATVKPLGKAQTNKSESETMKSVDNAQTQKNEDIKLTQSNSLSTMFRPSADTWECSVCMIRNNCSLNKCAACENPKPSDSSQSSTITSTTPICTTQPSLSGTTQPSLSSLFKKPDGNWDCTVCMVSNKAESAKCIACEGPKPGLTRNSSFTSAGGFMFGKHESEMSTSKPSQGFQMPSSLAKSNDEGKLSSGFKFGNVAGGSSNSISNPLTGGFKFGGSNIGKETDSSIKNNENGGFEFDMTGSSNTTQNFTSELKTGVKPDTESESQVKFGGTVDKDKTSALKIGGFNFSNSSFSKPVTSDKSSIDKKPEKTLGVVAGFKFGSDSAKPSTESTIVGGFKLSAESKQQDSVVNSQNTSTAGFSFSTRPNSNKIQPTSVTFTEPTESTPPATGLFTSITSTSTTTANVSGPGVVMTSASVFSSSASSGIFSNSAPKTSNVSEDNKKPPPSYNPLLFGNAEKSDIKEKVADTKSSLFTFGEQSKVDLSVGDKGSSSAGSAGFNFNAKSSGFGFGGSSTTTATSTPAANLFTFGTGGGSSGIKRKDNDPVKKTKETSAPDLFGSTNTTGGFNFGQPAQPTSNPAVGGFGGSSVFGGSTGSFCTGVSVAAPTSAPNMFQFNATTTSAPSNNSSAPFVFGQTSSAQQPAVASQAFNFQPNAQPTFNFGGAPTNNAAPGGAFQFSAGSGTESSNPFNSRSAAGAKTPVTRRPIRRATRKLKK